MTIPISELIARLRPLAEAATPGEWFPETYSSGHRQVCGNLRPVGDDEDAYTVVADVYKREDHEFLVAAAPRAILTLLDALEQRAAAEADLVRTIEQQLSRIADLNTKCRLYEASLDQSDKRIAELQPIGSVIDSYTVRLNSYDFQVLRARQIKGADLWKVLRGSECLSKSGDWEYEPLPSNRDDAFLARCRFESAQAAIDALSQSTGEIKP